MRLLCIFSGSIGHFMGLRDMILNVGRDVNIASVYASHVRIPHNLIHGATTIVLKTSPAYLNHEFLLAKSSSEVSRLKHQDHIRNTRSIELKTILEDTRPDLILVNSFNTTDVLLIRSLAPNSDCRVALYETKLSVRLRNVKFGYSLGGRYGYYSGNYILLKQSAKRLVNKLIFPGFDDATRMTRFFQEQNFSRITLDWDRGAVPGITDLSEFCISPSGLHQYRSDDQIFVGFCRSGCNKNELHDNILVSKGSYSCPNRV